MTQYFRINKAVAYALLTFTLCLFLTYTLFNKAKFESDKKTEAYFDFRVREATNFIKNRMQTYEQVLLGVAGLFRSSESVERNEFKKYVETLNLTKNYPGIQGVGFSQIIDASKKTQHIESIRKTGFPHYTIWPEGKREIYTSIIYLEPFFGRNLRAFGYDMFSEPVRHEAMQKAIDTGEAHLSGKIKLVQETGNKDQAGFLIYIPLYKNATKNNNILERQKNIIGWVYSPFRMDDLMEGLFGEYAKDLDISIYDGVSTAREAIMYDSNDTHARPLHLSKVITIEIANHQWTVHIQPLVAMNSRIESNYPNLIFGIGVIISVLLSLLIWFFAAGRERAVNIAKNMNSNLLAERERLANIIQGTRAGTWEWNVQTGETHFNENWANIIGYQLSELEPISIETWLKFVHPDDAKASEQLLQKHFAGELDYYELEVRMQHKNGDWVWVLDRGKVIAWSADGKPLLMAGTHQDINERKNLELELTRKAQFDHLTGLANRGHFMQQSAAELARAIRYDTPLSILMLDIDFFKKINDTYGHQIGDIVLKELGKVCRYTIREIDIVGRLGGEEFAIILPTTDAKEAIVIAERLRKNIANMEVKIPVGLPIHITISIGVSTLDNQNVINIDSLLNQADIALYEAKATGRNKVCVYKDWTKKSAE